MAKFDPTRLRAAMLADIQSIERYLKQVKEGIRAADSRKVQANCTAIKVEVDAIEVKNVQVAAV